MASVDEARGQRRVDVCAVGFDFGTWLGLQPQRSAVVVVVVIVQRVAGGLARGEDGRRVGGIGGRNTDGGGRGGRHGVGGGGGRRDVAVGADGGGGGLDGAAVATAGRGLLLFEDGIVAETLSLGFFAIVAGWVRLVALDVGVLVRVNGRWSG